MKDVIRKGRKLWRVGRVEQSKPATQAPQNIKQLMGMDYARFAHLLPYRYFDEVDQLFINTESLGFACEVAPLAGANEEVINHIADMMKNKLDHTICIQVMLIGTHRVGELLDSWVSGYMDSDDTFKQLGISQYKYFKHAGVYGFHNKRQLNMPLRDYRCFIFVSKRSGYTKAQATHMVDLREEVMTELKNTGINHRRLEVNAFIQLIKNMIHHQAEDIHPIRVKHDRHRELNEQMVDPGFSIKVHANHLELQTGHETPCQVVALSLRELPDEIMLWSQADHFSNILKPNMGIPCPFIISVHFKCEPQDRSKLKALSKSNSYEKKANSPYAKLIPGTVQAAQDWKKIRDDLSGDAISLCKVYYNCLLFTSAELRREHLSRTLAAFRVNGLEMYSIKYQQLQSYLAMMPFVVEQGLWLDLSLLGRLNTMTTWNLTNMLPLVGEYKGSSQGVLAPTFRHQMACIDNFNPSLDNYNACICATSGSGKSVLSQAIIASILADKGKAWVIDLGQSYKKFL